MSNSAKMVDYIGNGVFASRPVSPPVGSGVGAVYICSDTGDSYGWDGTVWRKFDSGAAGAMTQLSKTTLGSTTANINITSIPGTYSALLLQVQGRASDAVNAEFLQIQFNGDTAAHYDSQMTQAAGTGASTNQEDIATAFGLIGYVTGTSSPANVPGTNTIWIPNYAATVWNKQWHSQFSLKTGTASGQTFTGTASGEWISTAAITSILIFGASGSFLAGTVATLYGVS